MECKDRFAHDSCEINFKILSRVRVTTEGFGLVTGFTEHLQIVTTALSLIHLLCSSIQHVISLLSLLCHQLLPGDESEQCSLRPCSCSYRLATLSQLTDCSNCPAYNISARIAHKTSFICCLIHCCVRVLGCPRHCNSVIV
jgi:hypothetical protein